MRRARDASAVSANITAQKGGVPSSSGPHTSTAVEGLADLSPEMLPEIARAAEEGYTISAVVRSAVTSPSTSDRSDGCGEWRARGEGPLCSAAPQTGDTVTPRS